MLVRLGVKRPIKSIDTRGLAYRLNHHRSADEDTFGHVDLGAGRHESKRNQSRLWFAFGLNSLILSSLHFKTL